MPSVCNKVPKRSFTPDTPKSNLNQSGFTLIEMAVVMILIGIIISIAATVMPTLLRAGKVKKTEAILEKIDYAIQGYITANGRLPFADTDTDGIENSATTQYFGDVPFITLGLTSDEDVWGNRIKYGVLSDLTITDQTTFGASVTTACSTLDTTKLHVTLENGTQLNIAYVLVSGGAKDEDNIQGFFDGKNTGNDAEYDDPNQIALTNIYDDQMIAKTCNELSGQQGLGLGGSLVGSATGVENTDDLCTNGIDDDGDLLVDCFDQDCCQSSVTASVCGGQCPPLGSIDLVETDPISPGTVGGTNYNHTFQAIGGSGQYYWYLNNITPSIPGLSINLWSGALTGTVDACEGNYSVEVKVEDRLDSSITDTHQFNLTISNDTLNISPAPSGGGESNPDFTVNASTFTQNLSVSGLHSGDFTWTLNWTGTDPGGFQIVQIDAITAQLEKVSKTTAGSFTFTLNAVDDDCVTNAITSASYTITITAGGVDGPIPEGMESRWYFDECDAWSGTSFDVVDSLGNTEYYGKALGGVVQTGSGRFCRAASFAGGDDKIVSKVFTSDKIVFTDQTTLACWFKSPGGGSGSPRLIEFSDALGDYKKSTAICYDTDGSLRAWVTSESGVRGGAVDFSGTRYNDNKWHHAVYTYGSGEGKLYIDGVEKASASNNSTTDIHDAETFVMGGYYPNNSHGYIGLIDEVMIYSKALSQEEVTDLYNTTKASCSGSCYDDATTLVGFWNMDDNSWIGDPDDVADSGYGQNNGTASGGQRASQTSTTEGKPNLCRAGVFASRVGEPRAVIAGKYLSTSAITDTDSITRHVWTGIGGNAISALTSDGRYPNAPTNTDELTSFKAPTNWDNNYGTRVYGYLHPDVSGTYTFWISSDDNGELWLSTDSSEANKQLIASVPGWTSSEQWTRYAQQESVGIALEAGQRYYIEALQKEGGGGDNLAVAWERAVDGSYLDFGDPADGDLDPGTSSFTVSAWINWDGTTGSNIIYNKENLYEAQVSGGYVQYAWRPHWAWDGGTSFPVTAGEWTHVTTVYDGIHQILYRNGIEVFSRAQTGDMGSNSNKLLIGARGSGSPNSYFNGKIDQVKIFKRALSDSEVLALVGETTGCPPDLITITTDTIDTGVVGSAYPNQVIEATGGQLPYVWNIVPTNPIAGLSIALNTNDFTGNLSGTIDACAGTYTMVIRVTDGNSNSAQVSYPLTVDSGTITITPSPQQYTSTAADTTFSTLFTISGAVIGDFDFNDSITWLGNNDPGGFVLSNEDQAAKTITIEKTGASATGSYFFRISGVDTDCSGNTFDSGWYGMTVSP